MSMKQRVDTGFSSAPGRPASLFATPGRIAILRALPGLGDLLCAVPAWRALRAAYPQAHITLIGLKATRPLVERFAGYIDDFLPFPGYPGLSPEPPTPSVLRRFVLGVQGRFDLALQMHGSGVISNDFIQLLGAKQATGFFLPGEYCPDPATFRPYPTHLSEGHRCLELVASLGIPSQGDRLEFPVQPADWAAFARLQAEHPWLQGNYVCLHPGASEDSKRWPVAYFAAVGAWLAEQGLSVVLTGTAGEKSLTRVVAHAMDRPVLDLAGRTPTGTLALLLQKARLLICNDTGVSHLAAAMRTPSVVIFSEPNLKRWAPLDGQRHLALGPSDNGNGYGRPVTTCATNQTTLRHAPQPFVTQTDVLDAAAMLLARLPTYAN